MKVPRQSRWEKRMAESAAMKLRVKRMVDHGMSLVEAADKVGVTKQRVFQIMQELRRTA